MLCCALVCDVPCCAVLFCAVSGDVWNSAGRAAQLAPVFWRLLQQLMQLLGNPCKEIQRPQHGRQAPIVTATNSPRAAVLLLLLLCAGCDLEPSGSEDWYRHSVPGCCHRTDHSHQPTAHTSDSLQHQQLCAGWTLINCLLRYTAAFPGMCGAWWGWRVWGV